MIYSGLLKFQHGNQYFALNLRGSFDSAKNGSNSYDPNALLFYKQWYNPVLTVKSENGEYLREAFNQLMVGGKSNIPLSLNNNGVLDGSLIDRYGICWNFSREDHSSSTS